MIQEDSKLRTLINLGIPLLIACIMGGIIGKRYLLEKAMPIKSGHNGSCVLQVK